MLYRQNVKNGDSISALGFGCMRYPMAKNGGIDEERTIRLLRQAIEDGVNYFDTAYVYHMGKSEGVLGRALADGYRERVKVATKLPPQLARSKEGAAKVLSTSLERLNTSYIDYYLLHSVADLSGVKRLFDNGVIAYLEEQKAKGVIRNLGFSFHGKKGDFEEILKYYDWDFCQIQYNILDEYNQATRYGLELAYELNIPVVIMEPLRGGMLANKVPAEVKKHYDNRSEKRTPAEWALRWVWDHKEVLTVLSGMSDEEQLSENIVTASDAPAGCLADDEKEMFKSIREEILSKTKVPCTGCHYCMPCPAGVNIPGCFTCYNEKYLLGKHKSGIFKYGQQLGMFAKKPGYAGQCIECGKCEPACPQHIEIRKELKNVRAEFEKSLMFKPVNFVVRTALGLNKKEK